jgi:hypothetical protein
MIGRVGATFASDFNFAAPLTSVDCGNHGTRHFRLFCDVALERYQRFIRCTRNPLSALQCKALD